MIVEYNIDVSSNRNLAYVESRCHSTAINAARLFMHLCAEARYNRHLYESCVAAVAAGDLKRKVITPSLQRSMFELLWFTMTGSENMIAILLIYHPSSKPVTDIFFEDLT